MNDQHGHDAGDRVLIRTAKTLRNSIREIDVLCRWGGEEFLILCPETDLSAAEILAERLRRALEEAGDPQITASFGGAVWHTGEEPSQVLSRADKNLYTAKEAGRNQTCVAP